MAMTGTQLHESGPIEAQGFTTIPGQRVRPWLARLDVCLNNVIQDEHDSGKVWD
jgi:hypothetical protein